MALQKCPELVIVPPHFALYKEMSKAFKNISTSIGDSLSEGKLTNEDGLKTSTGNNGHFDFYEYETCDLSKTFLITKYLIETEDEKD